MGMLIHPVSNRDSKECITSMNNAYLLSIPFLPPQIIKKLTNLSNVSGHGKQRRNRKGNLQDLVTWNVGGDKREEYIRAPFSAIQVVSLPQIRNTKACLKIKLIVHLI